MSLKQGYRHLQLFAYLAIIVVFLAGKGDRPCS